MINPSEPPDAPITKNARLKVQRANRHIDTLRQASTPLDRRLYRIICLHSDGTGPYPDRMGWHLIYMPAPELEEMFALLIGDAVHNLRAALDHFAGSLLRSRHPNPPKRPFFPFSSEREGLIASKEFGPIEEALPGFKETFLQEIRPADGPNERLWMFNELDNVDKHNLLIPTISILGIKNINIRVGGGEYRDFQIEAPAAYPTHILIHEEPITIGDDFDTTVNIRFGDVKFFKDDPVIPTLTQISELIIACLDRFDEMIVASKT